MRRRKLTIRNIALLMACLLVVLNLSVFAVPDAGDEELVWNIGVSGEPGDDEESGWNIGMSGAPDKDEDPVWNIGMSGDSDEDDKDGGFFFADEDTPIYDLQPQTMEEVQAAIDAWMHEGADKPKWQYEVAWSLMPRGFRCELVDDDDTFGAEYYTFLGDVMLAALSLPVDEDGYYIIKTPQDLDEVRNELDGKFRVYADIDLTGYVSDNCTAGQGWVGIGKSGDSSLPQPFTGEFDGQGDQFTISGLWCKAPSGVDYKNKWHSDQGLFGYTDGAEIYNVNLKVGDMVAYYEIGGVVGTANNGTRIYNCTVTGGSIKTTGGGYAGGIVGRTNDNESNGSNAQATVIIENCRVYNLVTEGNIAQTSGNYAGGIAGVGYNTEFLNCYTEHISTSSYSYPAGLIGAVLGNSIVNKCYAIEPIVEARGSYAGGLIGTIYGNSTVTDCWVIEPKTTAETSYSAGFAGEISNGTVMGCYVKKPVAKASRIGAGGFAGVLIETTIVKDCWVIDPDVTTTRTSGETPAGGFAGDIYNMIGTVENCYATNPKVTCGGQDAGGFAGRVYGEEARRILAIINCHAYNPVVTANQARAGGFAGYVRTLNPSSATFTSCSAITPTVTTSATGEGYGGGFAGYVYGNRSNNVSYPTFTDCYAAGGTVTNSGSRVGGFIGHGYIFTMQNCFAQVDVFKTGAGAANAGGLIGHMQDGSNTIVRNSYATGSVTVSSGNNVGGLVGYKPDTNSVLENCYATGTVIAPNSTYVGGLIGLTASGGSGIKNCYYDTTTTRRNYPVGGATSSSGSTHSQIKALTTKQMISGTDVILDYQDQDTESGDSANPWYIDEEITYPYLFYQYNGHSDDDRDYNLGAVTYADGQPLGQFRADFKIEGDVPFQVTSAGAEKAYFPYTGTSQYDVYHGLEMDVPSADFATDSDFYSLGGVSATHIIGFAGLPGAVKGSDRLIYDKDDVTTYTYVGETVTYEITVTNHSRDYYWEDVVLSDPLPVGVTLVEGTVTAEYQGGTETSLGKTTPVPYYNYNETLRELTVYLGTLDASEDNGVEWVTVRFQAKVGDAALSALPLDPTADNIRNRGTVNGVLRDKYTDEVFQSYTTRFDDRNIDPVFTLGVLYDGNGHTSGSPPADGAHYLSGDTVIVRDRGTLEKTGFYFHGWSPYDDTDAMDPQAVIYHPGDTLSIDYADILLYAVWHDTPPLAEEFDFYKVDGDTYKGLSDARFTLYYCDKKNHGAGDHIDLDQSGTCWFQLQDNITSGSDGLVHLEFGTPPNIDLRYFLLVETKAPNGYGLPSARWLLYLEDYWKVVTLVQGYTHDNVDVLNDKDINGDSINDFYMPNYKTNYQLPEAGGAGTMRFTASGVLLMGAGFLTILRVKQSRPTVCNESKDREEVP